jgi:8-oxo-dGTP diphosphatase
MGIGIEIRAALPSHTHDYASFSVSLHPFICTITSGEIVLHEHADATWVLPERLCTIDWAEADFPVIDSYLAELTDRHHEAN